MGQGRTRSRGLTRPGGDIGRSAAGDTPERSGPLRGLRIVELAGIGPGPFCAMMLADMGADVVRVDRASFAAGGPDPGGVPQGILHRSRRSVGIDLKHPDGVETLLGLVAGSDGLLEGYRPGVAERLGFGPQPCHERNPRLVYGRMTGWGQSGPLAHTAGHDINYLGLAGLLAHLGTAGGPPIVPLPLIGDFAGGAMFLAFGMVCALLEASRSGLGQVVDAAVLDGAASLGTVYHGLRADGLWSEERGTNFNDGGSHYYNIYECSDGQHITLGSYEPAFYAELLRRLGMDDDPRLPDQHDPAAWPSMKQRLSTLFKTRTRAQWCELLEGTDVCFAPVLSLTEAPLHPHNVARGTFLACAGVTQPAPAPRFSRTPGAVQNTPAGPGEHTDEVLHSWLGLTTSRITELRETGAIA